MLSGLTLRSACSYQVSRVGLGFAVWAEPFVTLRVPKLFNLRTDPFEIADHTGMDYDHWRLDRIFLLVPAIYFRPGRTIEKLSSGVDGRG